MANIFAIGFPTEMIANVIPRRTKAGYSYQTAGMVLLLDLISMNTNDTSVFSLVHLNRTQIRINLQMQ